MTQLRRALADSELRLYLQPKARVEDGRIIGAEALVRWEHPQRGTLSPTEFVPLLEETGYRYEYHMCNLTPALHEVYHGNAGNVTVDLQLGRFTLAGVTRDELAELCTEQFFVRARPA